MTSQWHHRWARPVSKCAGVSYGSNDTFGAFLAHSVQKLWSLIDVPATIMAGAGEEVTWSKRIYLIIKFAKRFCNCFSLRDAHTRRYMQSYLEQARGCSDLKLRIQAQCDEAAIVWSRQIEWSPYPWTSWQGWTRLLTVVSLVGAVRRQCLISASQTGATWPPMGGIFNS